MFENEKEKISLNGLYDEQVIQVVFDEDIIVPDTKEDIEDIIQVDGEVHIKKVNINMNKMDYEGSIEYDVLYIGADSDKNIYNILGDISISDVLNIDNIKFDDYILSAEVEHLQHSVINSRKLNLKIVVNLKLKTEKNIEKEIMNIKSNGDMQVLTKPMAFDEKMDSKKEKFMIKESILIPSSKPSVKNVLKCNVMLKNIDIRTLDRKVNVKGNISVTMLYNNYENSLELLEYDFPISEIIEDVNCYENMMTNTFFEIQDKYMEVLSDDDGEERIINLEIELFAAIDVISTGEREMISDVYSTSKKINLQKENLTYSKILLKNKNRSNIKSVAKINTNDTILQIYNVDGKIKIDNIEMKKDGIEVNGVIDCKILYIVADDKAPVKSQNNQIVFSQLIDATGVNENMKIKLDSSIEHIGFNMMAKNEIELKTNLIFDTTVFENKTVELITNINEEGEVNNDNLPSMTIYVAKAGDTFWNIAKKYNTTIQEIEKTNNIENSNNVSPGQKIVILKNTNFA